MKKALMALVLLGSFASPVSATADVSAVIQQYEMPQELSREPEPVEICIMFPATYPPFYDYYCYTQWI